METDCEVLKYPPDTPAFFSDDKQGAWLTDLMQGTTASRSSNFRVSTIVVASLYALQIIVLIVGASCRYCRHKDHGIYSGQVQYKKSLIVKLLLHGVILLLLAILFFSLLWP